MHAGEGSNARLLIRAIAAIFLGSSGIAAVMAWVPTSAGLAETEAQFPAAPTEGNARVRAKCAECGVVEATREIDERGEGVDPGAAGRLASGGRNGEAGLSIKRYEVTVLMKDGSRRMFMAAAPLNWRPRERVILIENAFASNDSNRPRPGRTQ